jgi:L-lactate dehydrogenase
VRYANITIIEGTGASALGIGIVSARMVEMIVRDERGGRSHRIVEPGLRSHAVGSEHAMRSYF